MSSHKEILTNAIHYRRYSPTIPTTALGKIHDLIISTLSTESDITHHDLEAEEQDSIPHHKKILEILGFLLQWSLAAIDARESSEKQSAGNARPKGGKSTKSKTNGAKEANWDPAVQIQNALETMAKVMKLKLAKIFINTSERDTFVSLFTRPVYLLLENETRVKNTAIRMHAFKVLCIAVKHHGHANGLLRLCEHSIE